MKIEGLKLFIVEFGRPDMGSYISFGGQQPLFVMAHTYDEAADKAMAFAENKCDKPSVVSYDGSLNLNPEELKIKTIRLACDEIVW